jgi:hypothetical protein
MYGLPTPAVHNPPAHFNLIGSRSRRIRGFILRLGLTVRTHPTAASRMTTTNASEGGFTVDLLLLIRFQKFRLGET